MDRFSPHHTPREQGTLTPWVEAGLEPVSRPALLTIVRTALAVGEIPFARRAALAWLTFYPGDLPVNLLHAQTLLREQARPGRPAAGPQKALPLLESLVQADPEYLEAYELLARTRRLSGAAEMPEITGSRAALGGLPQAKSGLPAWSDLITQARRALNQEPGADLRKAAHSAAFQNEEAAQPVLEMAEQLVHQALAGGTAPALAAVTHLQVAVRRGLPGPALRSLAGLYRGRWPTCLHFLLYLADALMDGGESDQAVALLHEAATRDVTGQVAERLWGPQHPYRLLWPEKLEARLELPLPAAVAAALGLNRLPPGPLAPNPPAQAASSPPSAQVQPPPAEAKLADGLVWEPRLPDENLRSVEAELTRVAGSVKNSSLARSDGRFPVYVLMTTRQGLENHYGPQDTALVESAMHHLADAIRSRKDWEALVYFADEGYSSPARGGKPPAAVKPAKADDPWNIKLALADLDRVLGRRGQMIGCLLIVGGPEVVPFHHLPNPVDDADLDVPSDNPYTTRDENYFVPEWPAGRLPGGCSREARYLLGVLASLTIRHTELAKRPPWYRQCWQWLAELARRSVPGRASNSLGYTAAVWKRASQAVFRPIGSARELLVSPPVLSSTNGLTSSPSAQAALLSARLGYFNLHGLPDAVEWYGQCDPTEPGDGPDYPVALRPRDLAFRNGHRPPQVVFSEACYGAHIFNKTPEEALALTFLGAGSQAVVGSTCTAYGAVTDPLTAADLLGFAFWNHLKDGLPAGEALRRAKVHLARVMHRRQGYLDGEDQKTLISFVLYGDPLAQINSRSKQSKGVLRMLKSPGPVKAVCDRSEEGALPQPVPPQVITYVKHVVAQYLPGMADAEISFTQEHAGCQGEGHTCPTSQLGAKAHPVSEPHRRVITLSKQVRKSAYVHRHYARLTLDAEGKLVKLVVSR